MEPILPQTPPTVNVRHAAITVNNHNNHANYFLGPGEHATSQEAIPDDRYDYNSDASLATSSSRGHFAPKPAVEPEAWLTIDRIFKWAGGIFVIARLPHVLVDSDSLTTVTAEVLNFTFFFAVLAIAGIALKGVYTYGCGGKRQKTPAKSPNYFCGTPELMARHKARRGLD